MPTPKIPLLEYDPTPESIIDPFKAHPNVGAPENCIVCFFRKEIDRLREADNLTEIAKMTSEAGKNCLYKFLFKGNEIAIFQPGVGAALCGGNLEIAIASGCKRFIVIGSAGVLDSTIAAGTIMVPTSAVRDEGTSYHYLPPSREVQPHSKAVKRLTDTLDKLSLPYQTCKTWTTDGFYRETWKKTQARRKEGCLTVEMEASAFFAIAKFRGVELAQLLYGGDDVSGEEWDTRSWTRLDDVRYGMFEVARDACLID